MPRSFQRKKLTSISSSLGTVLLDVTTDITSSYQADLTEHPVEDGSFIADHATLKTPTLNVRGMVSDARFTIPTDSDGNIINLTQVQVKNLLEDMWRAREFITYSDLMQVRQNMIITSLSFPTSNQSEALMVDIQLSEPALVSLEVTASTVFLDLTAAESDKGTQSGTTSSRTSTNIKDISDAL